MGDEGEQRKRSVFIARSVGDALNMPTEETMKHNNQTVISRSLPTTTKFV